MVVLMLDDPGLVARELLVVGLQLLVEVTHADRQRTRHIGIEPRKRQAALVVSFRLFGIGVDLGIDERLLEVGARRVVLGPRGAVDDEKTQALADLRSGQPHASGFAEGEKHVVDELFQIGKIGSDRLAGLAQHLVAIDDNRINHWLNSM